MKKPTTVMDARAQELLAKRALEGLDPAERTELRELGAEHDDTFDLTAAAIALATQPGDDALPAALAGKILRTAGVWTPPEQPVARPRGVAAVRPYLGWIAAAACLLLAIVVWTRRTSTTTVVELPIVAPPVVTGPPAPPSPAVARTRLVAAGAPAFAWKGTRDPNAAHVSGDVVWSPQDQQGYMRFVGLVPNDPSYQYQLWIFDDTRDARYPVDGGVFDVPSTGEVVVPIAAKLHVTRPTLFAITIERPGGVVVSKRERIVVTAGPS